MGGGVWTLNNLGVMLNIIWYYQVQGLCRVDPTADHRNGRNDEDCILRLSTEMGEWQG